MNNQSKQKSTNLAGQFIFEYLCVDCEGRDLEVLPFDQNKCGDKYGNGYPHYP
jgi:hypothetical protein